MRRRKRIRGKGDYIRGCFRDRKEGRGGGTGGCFRKGREGGNSLLPSLSRSGLGQV